MSLSAPRIREDGPVELRRIIESAAIDEPSQAELAALAAMLPLAKVPAAASSAAAVGSTGVGVKLVLAGVLAVGIGLGVWGLVGVPGAVAPTVPAAPVAPPVVVVPEPAPPSETAPAAAQKRPHAPVAAPAQAPQVAEQQLLDRAFDALQRGEPEAALAATREHERDFPGSALAEEREVLGIKALIALGRANDAEARLAAFRRRFPGSGHLPALESALQLLP